MTQELLLMCPLYEPTMRRLEDTYRVHRVWEGADRDALLSALGERVRAMATIGHERTDATLLECLPALRMIACFGVGYDGVDLAAVKARGIALTNTPDVLTECVADNALALILATVRRTAFNDRFIRAGRWLRESAPLTDRVWGESLGIVGLGRIGQAIARRAEAFGMSVAYHGRRALPGASYRYCANLTQMAREVSILVVACPGGEATRGIVSREVLQALGPQGYLVNISRGSTIDEEALVEALCAGRLAGAGLDVFTDEPHVPEALLTRDNVTLQPHVSSGTHYTRAAMGQLVVDNLAAWFAGEPLLTPV